jgi:hypothetical protein
MVCQYPSSYPSRIIQKGHGFNQNPRGKMKSKLIIIIKGEKLKLAAARAILLAKNDDLELVVASKHTSTSHGTKNVCTSTFE